MADPVENQSARHPGSVPSRRTGRWLIAILVIYAVFRVPFILNQLGGQDEELFAVPGLTVAREGVPRIPYYPATNPDVFFYRADQAVFALPPGLFYLQAPFFMVLPAGYPTGRWPCFVAGAIAIWLVYELARRAAGVQAGLWAAAMYAVSRVLFFAATVARPDEPCAAFGLGAILFVWNYADTRRLKHIIAAGGLLGLGLLCHPFAIIYCLICGVWTLLIPAPVGRRIASAAVLTSLTLVVFSAWLPLILAYREVFEHQFFNNVLKPAGPGLSRRLLWPWPYVTHQAWLLWEQAGGWQAALMMLGLLGATVQAFRQGADPALRRLIAIVWGSLYLLTATQGFHPTKGYWCFTGALVFTAAGVFVASAIDRLSSASRLAAVSAALAIAVLFLPQAGLRTWWKQIVPTEDDRYNGPEFTRRLIAGTPAEGRLLVESAFIFDFWLAGRDVTVRTDGREFMVPGQPYDWLVQSRDGLRKNIPQKLDAELVQSFGQKDDPLACYAELHRPRSEPSSLLK